MFNPHFRLGAPSGGELLAELGVRPALVREVSEDERTIRCPDRGADYPAHGFANLSPDPAFGHALHEAAPDEPWDPASSLSPADQRWRRA